MAWNAKRARAFFESLREASSSRRTQLRIIPAEGSWRVIECQGNPVRGPGGELQMIVLICRDLKRWLEASNSDASNPQQTDKTG